MAVLADVFVKEVPNRYKGSVNNRGQVDTRDTIKKICLAFLTTETIEIDGKVKPRYASYWGSASWGTIDYPSNVRKFIKAWFPKITDAMIDGGIDLDTLIGRGAYITITQNTGKDGKVYANIVTAMQPPPGVAVPLVPADFERHHEKEMSAAEQPQTAPGDEDEAPF